MTALLVGMVIAATALVGSAPVAPAAPAETSAAKPTVIADGHVDLGPRFVDGRWTVQLRDDSTQPAVWRDLSEVVLHAGDTASVTVPPDAAFSFLGQPGSTVWMLPQVQRPGILWPGWNTQDQSVVGAVKREATWRLHEVDGPGKFALFLNGNFGAPEIVFDSSKPYPQETGIEAAAHVHGNWAFSSPGSYRLDVEMLATTVDGAAVADRRSLRIFVGTGDPTEGLDTTAPATPSAPSTSAPTTTSADTVVVAADVAEPNRPNWPAVGGAALGAVALATILLVWLRRNSARRTETST